MQAQVVIDSTPFADERHGPGEIGRVGFLIGNRCFWVGSYSFPGSSKSLYDEYVTFATEVCDRWNAVSSLAQMQEGS